MEIKNFKASENVIKFIDLFVSMTEIHETIIETVGELDAYSFTTDAYNLTSGAPEKIEYNFRMNGDNLVVSDSSGDYLELSPDRLREIVDSDEDTPWYDFLDDFQKEI